LHCTLSSSFSPSTPFSAYLLHSLRRQNTKHVCPSRWHPARPTTPSDRAGVTHLILAFAQANATASYQPHVPINTLRTEYPGAKLSVAIGGWGDTAGFSEATKTDAGIARFAQEIQQLITRVGVDGIGEFIVFLDCPAFGFFGWEASLLFFVRDQWLTPPFRHRLGVPGRQRRRLQANPKLSQRVRDCCIPQAAHRH
jgi:hypothetical protein